MNDKLDIQRRILKHQKVFKHDLSAQNISLSCSNGKFKVNPNVVAGIYYLFEHILLKLSDEDPTVVQFPNIETEDLEISFLSLYQQQYEESICRRWQTIISDAKLEEVTLEDKENAIPNDSLETLEDNPVTIEIMKKPKTITNLSVTKQSITCELCGKEVKKKNMKCHLDVVHEKDPERKKRRTITNLNVSKQSITCELCGKEVRKKNMKRHLEITHGKDPEKKRAQREKLPCELCGKEIRISSMSNHLLRHARPDKKETCSICGEQKTSVKQHMLNVHGIGEPLLKVSCHVCGKIFKSKFHLTAHLRTHEEKRPCTVCGAQVKQMKNHMSEFHTPNDQKKHKCPDCGKGFHQTTKLAQHRINVHLRDRPFPCRYGCEFRYNDASNRNSHENKKHGGLFNKQTGPSASVESTDYSKSATCDAP